jgi:hypothetical protein
MDLWPAPYKNGNSYWCFIYDQKISGRIFLQTSVIFTVSTQCYMKGPYKDGELQANVTYCFHCPAMQHPLLGGESVSLMMPLHTCEQRVTNPLLLHIIIHFTKTGLTLYHSPLYSTKANSITAA